VYFVNQVNCCYQNSRKARGALSLWQLSRLGVRSDVLIREHMLPAPEFGGDKFFREILLVFVLDCLIFGDDVEVLRHAFPFGPVENKA
jgi:hypothetical protein